MAMAMDKENIPCPLYCTARLYRLAEMGQPSYYDDTTYKLGWRTWIAKRLYKRKLDVAICKAGCDLRGRPVVSRS